MSYGLTYRAPNDTNIGTAAHRVCGRIPPLPVEHGRSLIDGKLYPVAGRVCMDQH